MNLCRRSNISLFGALRFHFFFVISTAFMAGSVVVPECLLLCPQNATMQERLVPLQPIDLGAN